MQISGQAWQEKGEGVLFEEGIDTQMYTIVSRVLIQTFLYFFRLFCITFVSLSIYNFFYKSEFGMVVKLMLVLGDVIIFQLDISDLWLFRCMLNYVSALLTYCILHKVHSIRYIKYLFLQFAMKVMEYHKGFLVFVTCKL